MHAVKCIETGKIFRNAKEAAHYMDIAPSAVYQALRERCAAKSYHFIPYGSNEERVAILENEIVHCQQRKAERIQQRKTNKDRLVDLFKSWYFKELTIRDCSRMSGYSVGYLYQRFKQEKVMRGLD